MVPLIENGTSVTRVLSPIQMADRLGGICCLLHNQFEYENGDRGSDSGYYMTGISTRHIVTYTVIFLGLLEHAVLDRKVQQKSLVKSITWIYCADHAVVRGNETLIH